jgi:hypothetical protein
LVLQPALPWASAAGAGVGHMMDNQEAEMRQALAASEAATVRQRREICWPLPSKAISASISTPMIVRPGLFNELVPVHGVKTPMGSLTAQR